MLSSKQVRYLRSQAHHLRPSVEVGKQGPSATLKAELSRRLGHEELLKVRIAADDRQEFRALASDLAAEAKAELVQTIGRIALLYREAEEPKIRFP